MDTIDRPHRTGPEPGLTGLVGWLIARMCPAAPAASVAARRVTLERPDAPRKMRPEPPRRYRKPLAIGPYAPRYAAQGNVVVELARPSLQADNLFRDDFVG
ncbi:MAG: hypothetical protein QNJ13_09995 [Paracoccaceae bacterium]|nr:hypothetical protein [Paracoccaceae bacterium]